MNQQVVVIVLNEAALLESLKRIKDEKLIIIVSHRKVISWLCDEIIEIESRYNKKLKDAR